jgi:TolA-binding protein
MRSAVLCFALMLLAASVWAQEPAQAPAPPAESPKHHHDMAAMQQQHLQEMKDQVAKMRATLEQMKANLAKVKDRAVKQQSQFDIDLWEDMVKHIEEMVSMMPEHPGTGMRGMHHDVDEKAAPPAPDKKDNQ